MKRFNKVHQGDVLTDKQINWNCFYITICLFNLGLLAFISIHFNFPDTLN